MKHVKLWGSMFILSIIMLCPETTVLSAQGAMRTWYYSVAPALFPFLVLMPLLTGNEACTVYGKLFAPMMKKAFGLPGAAAPAVIIGMLTGSPGGALSLRRIAGESGMRCCDAQRIALSICGLGPAYLIMGVGYGLYGNISLGLKLAGIQLAVQLVMLSMIRISKEHATVCLTAAEKERERTPIVEAVEVLLGICGSMVFFSIVAGVGAKILGERAGTCLLLLVELPSGLSQLASADFPAKMLIQGAAIGFGGICIAFQNMGYLKTIGVSWKQYIGAKLVSSLLFGVKCVLLLEVESEMQEKLTQSQTVIYAGALLIACISVIPVLIRVTNQYFLNKRKLA